MSPFDPAALAPPLRIPELAGGPIVLRPYLDADLDLVRQASADPSIASSSSVPRLYTDAVGRAFIERQSELATHGDGYSFVIAEASVPSAGVGSIGLWLRDIENGRASVGYWLLERARSRGLAAHALRTLVAFAFGELAIPRLHAFVEPWNVDSARVAEAGGFHREALLSGWERTEGDQVDVECFSLLHRDWEGHD